MNEEPPSVKGVRRVMPYIPIILWSFTAGCLFTLALVDAGWRWREAREAAAAEQVISDYERRVDCDPRDRCLWV